VVTEQGARVGNTHTAVEAGWIRTVSIGCDSRIWLDKYNKIKVGHEKVTPLSQLAQRYDHVAKEMQKLNFDSSESHYLHDIEYWGLYKPIEPELYNTLSKVQQKVVDFISKKPERVSTIIQCAGVYHKAHLDMDMLISHGYIECSSVTPSDLFHADGSINIWDKNTARVALDYASKVAGVSNKKFIESTINTIVSLLVEEIIIYLACKDSGTKPMPVRIDGEWGRWMLKETLVDKNDFITINLDSKVPIIGTGAPAELFLKRSAEHLNAHFVLPENFEVANAVGAVSGSIMATREALVFTQQKGDTHTYVVKYKDDRKFFEEHEEACEYAENKARKLAKKAIKEAGATDPYVEMKVKTEGSLQRFTARAVGNPKISQNQKFYSDKKEVISEIP